MGKNYLQISFGDGSIFQYSKTPKEGYESHTSSKGDVSYRKVYNKGLYGVLKGVSLKDGNFGDEISIEVLDCNGDTNYLSLSLLTAKGNIGPFAESFISYLPYLEIGRDYRIYPYSMEIDGSTFTRKGISIRHTKTPGEDVWMEDDYKISKITFTYYDRKRGEWVQGMVPPIEQTTDFKGETKTNTDKKDAYLFNEILLKYISKDERKKNSSQNSGQQNNSGNVPPVANNTPPPVQHPNTPPQQQYQSPQGGMAPNQGFHNAPVGPNNPPVQGGPTPGNNVPPLYNPGTPGQPGHATPPPAIGPNNPGVGYLPPNVPNQPPMGNPGGMPFPPTGPGTYQNDDDDLPF